MNKFLFKITLLTTFLATTTTVFADSYMSMPDTMNARMFSTQGARPLTNLERTNFDNQQIMRIEEKQNPRKQEEQANKQKNNSDEPQEKTKFKDYFKNFVFEW